jgi:hypothetical protein
LLPVGLKKCHYALLPSSRVCSTTPIIFDRIAVPVQPRFDPHPVAMAEMINIDKYAAAVWMLSKPLRCLRQAEMACRLQVASVPLTEKLEDYDLPAQLESSVVPGAHCHRPEVGNHRWASSACRYHWPQLYDRYKRMARFVDHLVGRLFEFAAESRLSSQMERGESGRQSCQAGSADFKADAGWSKTEGRGSGRILSMSCKHRAF